MISQENQEKYAETRVEAVNLLQGQETMPPSNSERRTGLPSGASRGWQSKPGRISSSVSVSARGARTTPRSRT